MGQTDHLPSDTTLMAELLSIHTTVEICVPSKLWSLNLSCFQHSGAIYLHSGSEYFLFISEQHNIDFDPQSMLAVSLSFDLWTLVIPIPKFPNV